MLNEVENRFVRDRGFSINHDTELLAVSLGEPFLQDGILSFYDGRILSVAAFPFTQGGIICPEQLRDSVAGFLLSRPAEIVALWSPNKVDLQFLRRKGFSPSVRYHGAHIKAELVLDCNRAILEQKRRHLRPAVREQMRLRITRQPPVQVGHIRLIEAFFRERTMTPYLFEQFICLHVLRVSRDVRWLQAFCGEQLCGLAAVREPFATTDLALFLARDKNVKGVGDFLMYHMIATSIDGGKQFLNMGPSPTEGHYRFKLKWGAAAAVPPYRYIEWSRGTLRRRTYTNWNARALQYRDPRR